MAVPLCDFFDWTSHRRCDEPATWVTHQSFGPGARHYCDAHRPPRAHPMAPAPAPAAGPKPRKRRHKA